MFDLTEWRLEAEWAVLADGTHAWDNWFHAARKFGRAERDIIRWLFRDA